MAKLNRKLAWAQVMGEVDKTNLNEAVKTKGMAIIGTVAKISTVPTAYGESLKFGGTFKATNLDTGEFVRASVCYLPSILEDAVAAAFESSEGTVEFAFRVYLALSKKSPTGYTFEAESLLPVAESDAISAIEQRCQGLLTAQAS